MALRNTTATSSVRVKATSPQAGMTGACVRATSLHTGNMIINVASAQEVPSRVMTNTSNSQASNSQASSAEAAILKPVPSIKFSEIKAGDIVFKVATPKSASIYKTISGAQEYHVKNFCSHQDKLPVLANSVVHCDVAIGNEEVAHVGGPNTKKELAALGYLTPSSTQPFSVLEECNEDIVIARPKNKQVAERMAAKAKETVELPVTYDLTSFMTGWLLHKRGVEEPPLLKEGVQGPQVGPLEIPNSMICSHFASIIVMDSERETIKDDRNATTESVNMAKIVPGELIDKLAGSGNYDFFSVDKSKGK